jgi:hypothetical protein
MVAEWQFIAIAAFLMWCLASSLCGVLKPEPDKEPARLFWREHGDDGWSGWRQVHYGLTAADHRILRSPQPVLDDAAHAALLETVLYQARRPESDEVQFAIVRTPPEPDTDEATAVFVSAAHRMRAVRAG